MIEGRQIAEKTQHLLENETLYLEETEGQARVQLRKENGRIKTDHVTREIDQTYRVRLKKI